MTLDYNLIQDTRLDVVRSKFMTPDNRESDLKTSKKK